MKKLDIGAALGCLLALTLVANGVYAQAITGEIQGNVIDPAGNPLPGVTITATDQDTGRERTTLTNADGFYVLQALPSGSYTVRAALEGMQTVERPNVFVQVGQTIDINVAMQLEETAEVITVTAESPLIEVSRSGAASYVGEVEINNIPISGRDFKEFAFLAPTVQNDPVRGFVTMSGQRGIYTGLTVDGADNKSTFFGYGRGGEATENDGLVIAQDSVKEFQVITNGFEPEFGRSGGGSINVITKSGTNQVRGSAFYFWRDDSLAEDLPSSPLDDARGIDGSREVDEFERNNWGVSVGGPIVQDKTHYYFAYDQTTRDEPFTDSIRTRSQDTPEGISVYDAILLRAQEEPAFAALVQGYERNPDGSATGLFLRQVDNLILFGKVDHAFNQSNNASLRINYTDFERESDFFDEESAKLEDTLAAIGSWTSVIGSNKVNEFRIQYAEDNLDRLSKRVGEPIEAEIRFRFAGFDSVGKFDFLPIFVEEQQLQIKNDFSWLFGAHDTKFGIDYADDNLKQLFAGSLDGRYDYRSITQFLNNEDSGVRIYFGDVTFPNYDESQQALAIYAQDSWRRGSLTLNYGIRYEAEFNPDDLQHIFPEGRDIPDDTDNWGPRVGFAWSPDEGRSVLRGGIGLFFGRTPTLLFASQVQENGLFPNYGRVFVRQGDAGYVPLGQSIPNENPPRDTIPSTSFVDPSWDNAEFWRYNLGYENEFMRNWVAGVDVIYMEGENLQTNVDFNRQFASFDEFGRPIYSNDPVNPNLDTIFVRQGIGESEYTAVTLRINKRWSNRYQMQAHYTWSEDMDTDSNERSATSVTASVAGVDPATGQFVVDPRYDWGLSERDVEHRFLVSGVVELPLNFKIGGLFEWRDGTPWTAIDPNDDVSNYPGFNGPDERAVINGRLVPRNSFRDEDVTRVDLRASYMIPFGGRYQVDIFAEVFNLFDDNSFNVGTGQRQPQQRDGVTPNPEFGVPDILVTNPRQFQIGARFTF